MRIQARMSHVSVPHDKDHTAHLVLTLKAPPLPESFKRPKLFILPVIDISGSMTGSKLDYAKQSMIKLVENLTSNDACGLITFDNQVHEVYAPQRMTAQNRAELLTRVRRLSTGGSTNFSDAMLKAFAWAQNADVAPSVIRRVVMFTDGHPNVGIARDTKTILKIAEQNRQEVSISAFGYGVDADQEFLADLSKIGEGSYAFVQSPAEALSAFAIELGGLVSTYANDIRIEVEAAQDNKLVKVLSDVPFEREDGKLFIKAPDLLAEMESHVVIEMTLTKQKKAGPRAVNVAHVDFAWRSQTDGVIEQHEDCKSAKVKFTKKGEAVENDAVKKAIALAKFIAAGRQAREYVSDGEYQSASLILRDCAEDFNELGMADFANMANKAAVSAQSDSAWAASAGQNYSATNMAAGRFNLYQKGNMDVATSNRLIDDMRQSFEGPSRSELTVSPADTAKNPRPLNSEKLEEAKRLWEKRFETDFDFLAVLQMMGEAAGREPGNSYATPEVGGPFYKALEKEGLDTLVDEWRRGHWRVYESVGSGVVNMEGIQPLELDSCHVLYPSSLGYVPNGPGTAVPDTNGNVVSVNGVPVAQLSPGELSNGKVEVEEYRDIETVMAADGKHVEKLIPGTPKFSIKLTGESQ